MLEIEFSTKRVSWIFNISKIKKTTATGSLYIERPSYINTSDRMNDPLYESCHDKMRSMIQS